MKCVMIRKSETGIRIIKNAAWLAVGNIVGKVALFIAFIIVARKFGPEGYGTYNTAFTHVYLLGILSKLGFDQTVIREGSKDHAKAILNQNKVFALRFWVAVIVWALTILSALMMDYDRETIKLVLIMSPIILSGGAINSGMLDHYASYYMIVEKMKYATYVLIFRTILFALAVYLLFVVNILSMNNLAVVVLISSYATLWFQVHLVKRFYKQEHSLRIDLKYLKPLLKPILLFGICYILFEVSLRVNILMLNNLGSKSEVGYYSAAWSLVGVGTLFIVSFSTSLFPNSSRSIFNRSYRSKMHKGLLIGTFIFVLGSILTYFIADYVIELLYGSEYHKSAAILAVTIWYLPLRLLSLWGHQILESANYLYLRIVIFVIPTILNIVLNYIWIPKYLSMGSAYAALVSNMLLLVLSYVTALVIVRRDERFN